MDKDRKINELYHRLKERAEFNKKQAEADLKILEKWKEDYKRLK